MASIRKREWTSRGQPRSAWVVDYFDQAGKRRLKTFATKKEADTWAITALHEVKQGIHTAASASITVADAFQRWIDHCEADGLEFGTLRQRRQHLNLHVAPFIGREKLSSLTVPRVHQFDADLRAAGRSLAMRRKVLTNLKTAISYAQGQGLVAQNVARTVRLKSTDREAARGPLREGTDFPSKAELKALIDRVSTDRAFDRWRAFIITAIFTGMRISELRGLPWRDVDLDCGMIHVRQRADAWRRLGPPKSKAGARDIPLAPIIVIALRQWRAPCPKGELDLVFPNKKGNIETLQNLRERVFLPLQVLAGVATEGGKIGEDGKPTLVGKYGFHDLRHAAASLFIAHLGWTPKRVQTVMGHSSIRMTYDLYGHLFEDHAADREAMKKIEAAIVAA
jgi:integrase